MLWYTSLPQPQPLQPSIIYATATNQSPAAYPDNSPATNQQPHTDPANAIYSNITLPTNPQDSLNYATVNFTKEPERLNYSTVSFIKEAASSDHVTSSSTPTVNPVTGTPALYSTIEPKESVIYSNVRVGP